MASTVALAQALANAVTVVQLVRHFGIAGAAWAMAVLEFSNPLLQPALQRHVFCRHVFRRELSKHS